MLAGQWPKNRWTMRPTVPGEAQRRVGHGEADAILVLVRAGMVVELGIGDGDVAAAVVAGDVGKAAAQDQRDLGAVMGVRRHHAAGLDPVEHGLASLACP